MRLYFLEGQRPLQKQITKDADGKITIEPYPLVKNFTSFHHQVETIHEFYEHLKTHANKGHALLKGQLAKRIKDAPRAGLTSALDETCWICLDFDGVTLSGTETIDSVLAMMGLGEVSYILQYSASHNVTKPFSAHVFIMLEKPVLPSALKKFFMALNLGIPKLRESITLTRTNLALRWPLDVSLAQNDKLIYIGTPYLVGFQSPVNPRISFVQKGYDTVDILPSVQNLAQDKVETLKLEVLNDLRAKIDLPKRRKSNTKFVGKMEVGKNPEVATITEMREARGFVYLNLNGGDSWGYYHPVDDPEYIHNFKGEPSYKTSELLPEYYEERIEQEDKAKEAKRAKSDAIPFAFLDRKSDRYYRGTYDKAKDELELHPTSAILKIQHFLAQHEIPEPDFIEEWDYEFDFASDKLYDPENRRANRYQRSVYLRSEIGSPIPKQAPPTIRRVIMHALGNDLDCYTHFINWLAVIIQHRKKAETAWIISGGQGTGKGLLTMNILAPLVGHEYVNVKSLTDMEDQFNDYMEDCLFLVLNESKSTQAFNIERVMARLKEMITDPVISIRAMRSNAFMAPNNINLIVTSNKFDPIQLESSDRRFNVAPYQRAPLSITDEEVQRIENELLGFAHYLRTTQCDIQLARTPLDNEHKAKLKYLSQTAVEQACNSLREGNLGYFVESLSTETYSHNPIDVMMSDSYRALLRDCQRHAQDRVPMLLSRDQVKLLMDFAVSAMPKTPNKFTSLMKHHDILFARKRKDGALVTCLEVKWDYDKQLDFILDDTKLRSVK